MLCIWAAGADQGSSRMGSSEEQLQPHHLLRRKMVYVLPKASWLFGYLRFLLPFDIVHNYRNSRGRGVMMGLKSLDPLLPSMPSRIQRRPPVLLRALDSPGYGTAAPNRNLPFSLKFKKV